MNSFSIKTKSRNNSMALRDVLKKMAEGVGFEPTYRLLTDNSISSRARYGRFATPPRRIAESRRATCHSGIEEIF